MQPRPRRDPGIRQAVSALRTLGYRPHVSVYRKSLDDYWRHTADSRNKVQPAFEGWIVGSTSAGGFLYTWSCDGFTPANPNNVNPAEFCDLSTRVHNVQRGPLNGVFFGQMWLR